jgi:rhodanese-related sulfurtransferase
LRGLPYFLLITLLACLAAPAAFSATDGVPRMTVQELKAKMDRGEDVLIIDVRTGNDYERSRIKIKGAMRISIVNMEDKARGLPKDKEIVTYCT